MSTLDYRFLAKICLFFQFPFTKLRPNFTLNVGDLNADKLCFIQNSLVLRSYSPTLRKSFFRVYNAHNGIQKAEWETQCRGCLPYGSLLGYRIDGPNYPEQLLEACVSCKAIRAYNMDTRESAIVYKKIKPEKLCAGPNDTVLVWDSYLNTILQLARKDRQLYRIGSTGPLDFNPLGMFYNEHHNVLILTFLTNLYSTKTVAAMKLGGNSFLWERPLELSLWPQAECSISIHRFCLADENNLYIYDASNGELVENIKSLKHVCDLVSSNNGGSWKIAVRHGDHFERITCYTVTLECDDFDLMIPQAPQAPSSQIEP